MFSRQHKFLRADRKNLGKKLRFPIYTVIRHPRILRSYKHIFLLSHMRANTSLLGHILGSSPEVEGYYEMHIDYHDWRSLIQQRALFYQTHNPKPSAKFFFDKILHDGKRHFIGSELLRRSDVITIFSLREPQQTIRSIINLYRSTDESHKYSSISEAVHYYNQRITNLRNISKDIKFDYIYLDAQALRDDTRQALSYLTNEIGLLEPLKNQYNVQKYTGTRLRGDRSENIRTGVVLPGQTDYSQLFIDEGLISESIVLYEKVREDIISSSKSAFIAH